MKLPLAEGSNAMKSTVRRIGQLVTFAAVIFLGSALYQQWGVVGEWRPSGRQIGLLVVLTIAYASALMLLALNWGMIVQALSPQQIPPAHLLLSYTKTQIAKYIPGNVVHLISRHMYLSNLGIGHRGLATASVLELLSLPLSAIFAICLAISFTPSVEFAALDIADIAPFALVAVLAIAALVIWRVRKPFVWPACVVLLRGTVFMLCQGGIFAVILFALSESFVALAIPAAILAWLIGFLTPGAPGGIAVREVLLIGVLANAASGEHVLIAALLLRLVTTAGDLLLYLFGNIFLTDRTLAAGRKR